MQHGQHVAVDRHVDEAPRAPARAPGPVGVRRRQADLRGRGARGGEVNPGRRPPPSPSPGSARSLARGAGRGATGPRWRAPGRCRPGVADGWRWPRPLGQRAPGPGISSMFSRSAVNHSETGGARRPPSRRAPRTARGWRRPCRRRPRRGCARRSPACSHRARRATRPAPRRSAPRRVRSDSEIALELNSTVAPRALR